MDPDLDPDNPTIIVGTPQAGPAAGGDQTSGNPDDPDLSTVDPDNPDDDPNVDPDDPAGSDATTPALSRARTQAARYRRELRETETERDELAGALWRERVAALGVLADPDDLPLDQEALHDPDRLRELADELVARKPHLRSRRIRERAGQGEGTGTGAVSLAALLQRNA